MEETTIEFLAAAAKASVRITGCDSWGSAAYERPRAARTNVRKGKTGNDLIGAIKIKSMVFKSSQAQERFDSQKHQDGIAPDIVDMRDVRRCC
jgi:hypothetical protein